MKTERHLVRWGLLLINGTGPILSGEDPHGAEFRTSTALVEFDPDEGTGVTASGRPYRLHGPADPGYALKALHALWRVGKEVDVVVLSPDEAMRFVSGNKPIERTPEEQAASDTRRFRHIVSEIRLQMLTQGMDADDTADLVGIDADRLRSLLDGNADGWTVDEADAAFDTMCAAGRARGLM